MRKLVILIMLFSVLSCFCTSASNDISVYINGDLIPLTADPIIINDRVMVPIREIAEKMDCVVAWYDTLKTTEIYNKILTVSLTLENDTLSVHNEITRHTEKITLDSPPVLHNEKTYLPLRQIIEILGGTISWDDYSKIISINYTSTGVTPTSPSIAENIEAPKDKTSGTTAISSGKVDSGSSFYFQNEEKWQFPGFGSGYCWTCSYAMLISNLLETPVTPVDVAAVNEEVGGNGSYCQHWQIIQQFEVRFAPALNNESPYYGGYDSSKGATKINNPDSDDEVVRLALKEALELHPKGVMVRYEIYPHTMLAVKYENGLIYFNDPMRTDYEYKEYSNKEGVPFDQTCLRSYKLSDIEFIQALTK